MAFKAVDKMDGAELVFRHMETAITAQIHLPSGGKSRHIVMTHDMAIALGKWLNVDEAHDAPESETR